jgi:glutamine cyclotransferase
MGPRTWSYAVSDFEDAKELATPLRDGWGITSDGSHLVVGDSTDKLTWVDAGSMQSVRQVAVKGEAVRRRGGRGGA